MLPATYRLPSTQKLSRAIYKKTPLFSVKYVRNNGNESRFAFVVTKKIDKRAVIRNRIRRVFRSCIEQHLENITPGYDMLFFLEKGIIDKLQPEICQTLLSFLDQENLLQKKASW